MNDVIALIPITIALVVGGVVGYTVIGMGNIGATCDKLCESRGFPNSSASTQDCYCYSSPEYLCNEITCQKSPFCDFKVAYVENWTKVLILDGYCSPTEVRER